MTNTTNQAALLRAREPIAALLAEHAAFSSLFDQLWLARRGAAPAESEYTAETRKALAVARAINARPAAGEDVPALLAEVRRLQTELSRRVQCGDCGAVGEVFTGADGRAYLDPSGGETGLSAGARFGPARLTPVDSEETHVVADDSDDPEHVDDCPGCPTP